MTDESNFLARWSRRKANAGPDARKQLKPENENGDVGSEDSDAFVSSTENSPRLDPEKLPPIESIGAGSDIRPFLATGVPADLARAALRRVWLSDPKIRDFVGLSENSWDFNAPGAMAGFGPIDKEEAARVLTRLLGEPDNTAVLASSPRMPSQAARAEAPASEPRPVDKIPAMSSTTSSPPSCDQGPRGRSKTNEAATQRQRKKEQGAPQPATELRLRGHGSALPK